MRRRLLIFAALAAFAGTLSAPGVAAAREHGRHGGGHGRSSAWAHDGERGPRRDGPRDDRRGGRWERAPDPPSVYYDVPPDVYGAPSRSRGVRRGGYLPPEMRGTVVEDYGRYRLRPPPRGYGWVRSGRSLMLMDLSTGQIFDVIPD